LITDTIEQAIERAGTKVGIKVLMRRCQPIEMANLMKEIGKGKHSLGRRKKIEGVCPSGSLSIDITKQDVVTALTQFEEHFLSLKRPMSF